MHKEPTAVALVAVIMVAACSGDRKATSSEAPAPSAASAKLAVPVQVAEDRWEYVTFAPPDIVYDETLNRLGSEGWELVNARRVKSSTFGEMAYEITLRRRWRADRPSTTAQEQRLMALRAAIEKEKRALEVARSDTTSKAETTPTATAPSVETSHEPEYRIVGYKEHSEPVYEPVAVDPAKREYHLLQCPNAGRFPMVVAFASIKAQRIPRAADCANIKHPVVSIRTWKEPIREKIQKP